MKTTKQALKQLGTIDVEQSHVMICGTETAILIAVINKLNKDYRTASRVVCERVAKELFTNDKYLILCKK